MLKTNSPLSEIKLYSFQEEAIPGILHGIKNNHGVILIAPTGTGKTYALAATLKYAQDESFLPSATTKLCSVMWLTKKNIKVQSGRVLRDFGVKHFWVEAYDSMRASLGEHFIDWIKHLEYGTLAEKPVWRTEDIPDIMICDECQALKNENSQQSLVVKAFIEQGGLVIFASATPFVIVQEAKIVCMGLKLTTDHNWKNFAWQFCGNKGPEEISPANMERLTTLLYLQSRVIKFYGIKFKASYCIFAP